MSYADQVFIQNCQDILSRGVWDTDREVRPRWEDGTPAHTIKLFGVVNRYDLRREFPILTVRRQFLKSAVDELLWIWQKKSNNVHDLNSRIWDAWADESGSIGKAYGYQLGVKHHYPQGDMDQVDKVLWDLKHDPGSRRILTSLYNHHDLSEMALYPCAYSMTFNVSGNTLNGILNQRSQDMLTANGWNVMQYAVLLHMVAQVSGLEAGELVHVIADAHIYDRHVDAVREIITRQPYDAPRFSLDPAVTDFYAFTPDSVGALRYVQNFGIRTAGAESNVAVGLAKLGLEAAWVSRLGTDEFGCFIRNQLRAEGVDCSRVIYDPDHRTGIMFKETGVGETKVFYYRENSAASHLCPEDVTPALLDGVKVLHMSGITPVLSESCLAMTKAAFALAKEKGVAISFDPNIRRKLWRGQDYAPLIRELTLQSEIVLLGLDEADALFGLRDPDAIFDLLFRDGCAQYVAIKDGGNGAWVADKTTREKLPPYPCKPIEPIGAGDGFNAGFLAGILQGRDVVTAGRMGAICGALATQTPGDVEGYPDAAQMEAALTGAAITYR